MRIVGYQLVDGVEGYTQHREAKNASEFAFWANIGFAFPYSSCGYLLFSLQVLCMKIGGVKVN